ncbi:energy-coupling factor transporter transmembrane protein EcfT [Nocardioides panacis]|uniref:Energy-coupling factor transporter transmembrane protein EcfT n=1 Tax=Nocardioides panacis TaxID=2849501 RepID=A0A975SV06_9ACTN|nr:energy-coupling factor transporter transmembrane protein EcfT [Nocardioides panacis]QWZ06400.1 energy-coupling factor transporter transmembrane protein EcfT [Nocardioides panacis]
MRAVDRLSYPRSLHPGAWWLWAVALAAAASRTQNPVPLALILVVTGFVVAARRSNAPWARSYVAFLKLSLVIIVVRILFQALLSTGAQGPTVLFTLPSLPMPAGSGLKLGGVVSLEAILRAFYEGLQLATILCCVGAANALGSARRLLRYVPGALYEVGVACVIALTFAPQLVTDAARVRAAHRLRGQNGTGLRSLRRLAMPVLEGALERSVDLAAAMDSRGYGRTTDESAASRRLTGLLVFGGLLGVCVGIYGLLDGTASAWLGMPMLLVGLLVAGAGLHVGGRRSGRTRYRPDPWALPEWLVSACGVVAATAVFVDVHLHPADFYLASVTDLPPVPMLTVVGILVGALPAFLAPPLPLAASPHRPAPSATAGPADRMEVAA